jgi:hypothetical protein
MASGGSVSGAKACKCRTASASSKASPKDDPESELESEPPSESELSMDDMLVSISSTAANNKKIVADLRSSLIANTSAYESAKKESLKTFLPKEVRFIISSYYFICLFIYDLEDGRRRPNHLLSIWEYCESILI